MPFTGRYIRNDHVYYKSKIISNFFHDFSCTLCGKRFWWSSALSTHHVRVHSNSPNDLVCPWPRCGKKFAQPCKLRYHIRSHTGDKPYRCTYPVSSIHVLSFCRLYIFFNIDFHCSRATKPSPLLVSCPDMPVSIPK